ESHARFSYLGADEILRSLDVTFSMAPIVAPWTSGNTVANFDIGLAPQQVTPAALCVDRCCPIALGD
ncbi:MAG: hypothetical protein WA642_17365, partial [Steroidobacteraceae bacterium]